MEILFNIIMTLIVGFCADAILIAIIMVPYLIYQHYQMKKKEREYDKSNKKLVHVWVTDELERIRSEVRKQKQDHP